MKIYWIENGKRCGPATVPDIISRLELGELSPDTRGWHSGCSDWLPLRELPALADFLSAPPKQAAAAPNPTDTAPAPAPAAAEQEPAAHAVPEEAPTPEGARQLLRRLMPGAGARLLARLVDMSIYAALVLCVLHMLHAPYNWNYLPGSPLFWLPMPLLEALVLYGFRTTPGKRWLGIHLQSMQGQWTLGRMLMRSALVYIMGLGCMLGSLCLITMALSYFMLSRRGITLWDFRASTLPIHTRRPSAVSAVACFFFIFICMQLCGAYMMDWQPEVMEEIRSISPQWADFIEGYINQAQS